MCGDFSGGQTGDGRVAAGTDVALVTGASGGAGAVDRLEGATAFLGIKMISVEEASNTTTVRMLCETIKSD
jgi:hypothetical protein